MGRDKMKPKLTGQGGPGRGQGRKPSPYPTQLLKIKCTKEELQAILKMTTRERAKCLLAMASEL